MDSVCCVDVDDCLAANGGCDHTCQNTAGSFQCFCRQGFRLDEDRRSCELHIQQDVGGRVSWTSIQEMRR
uniref:EGF-like domain-containing protein n=1 Tax=Hucho hucho TaxID=62062 RepID=A0A4W5RT32_9TELE